MQSCPKCENFRLNRKQLYTFSTQSHSTSPASRSDKPIFIRPRNLMATSSSPDIPLLVSSEAASSERRISPSWTISQLKGRLEPITGVPSSCQRLFLKIGSQTPQAIEAANEDSVQLSQWPLQAYAEVLVGPDFSNVPLLYLA